MSIFNTNVIRRLEAAGLTIKELADKIGMQRTSLSRILNGHVDTTIGNAERIAAGLDTTLTELITAEKPANKRKKAETQAA
jgi:transcriptional regulator with XRE-family HTH domain